MNESRNLYNNELICAISIYYVLTHLKTISITKVMLIYPLVSHKETLDFLRSKNTKIRSLEELIIKKPDYFSNFNDRFYSFLILTINSLTLLLEMGLVSVVNNQLIINPDKIIGNNKIEMGVRAFSIFEAAPKLSVILEDEDINLYLQLRVEL
ncbi:three component ABC system middle component [Solibacillus sp. FSL R5-0691]|uniref:three component ABC system middle component n=1 Tax=Solibacillus sp. FSL R5-0691 TaxID=2921653 RepID=UPI0030CFB174